MLDSMGMGTGPTFGSQKKNFLPKTRYIQLLDVHLTYEDRGQGNRFS